MPIDRSPRLDGFRFRLGVGLGDGIGPHVNGLARLPDSLSESLFLIKVPPLAALVELNKMTQRPARGEKLPFGVSTLHFSS